MLTILCECGEIYHTEERYIGSSILCRECGSVIAIERSASLSGGQLSTQEPGFAEVGSINSQKRVVVFLVAGGALVIVVTLIAMRTTWRGPQRSEALGQPTSTSGAVESGKPASSTDLTQEKTFERARLGNQPNKGNLNAAPQSEPLRQPLKFASPVEPAKENPTIAPSIGPTNLIDEQRSE